MKITIDQVMNWHPCYGRDTILKLSGGKESLTPLEIARLKHVKPEDKLWLLLRPEIIPEDQLHWLATDFACQALPIWYKHHPDDKRPAQAIQAKRDWLTALARNGLRMAAATATATAPATAAVRAAVRAAAREWQLERVVELLEVLEGEGR